MTLQKIDRLLYENSKLQSPGGKVTAFEAYAVFNVISSRGSPVVLRMERSAITSTRLHALVSGCCTVHSRPNFVFSPWSILAVFRVALSGAKGNTRDQMAALVAPEESFQLPYLETQNSERDMKVLVQSADKIYCPMNLENSVPFAEFCKKVHDDLGSEVEAINFANSDHATEKINSFVSHKTHGRIESIISPGALNSSTSLVLVNALYFKAPWNSPFRPEDTFEDVFKAATPEGLVDQRVKFMQQKLERGFTFYSSDDVVACSLIYTDYRLRMYIFVPSELSTFEKRIADDPREMESLAERVRVSDDFDMELQLRIPKFGLLAKDNSIDLVHLFRQLGASSMFDPGSADFSGISGERNLHVDKFLHQSNISIDEEGTEATAATAMRVVPMCMPIPKREVFLIANKPFLFQIRFEEDGKASRLLFSGRIADAKAAQLQIR